MLSQHASLHEVNMTNTLLQTSPNQTLATLRAAQLAGDILAEAPIVPGLRFVPDPEAGMQGRYTSPAGRLLEMEVTHARPARWLGLHLALDVSSLDGLGLIGFAATIASPRAMAVTPCVRSGTGTGFADCFFAKSIAAMPRPLMHLDAIETGDRHETLMQTAPWRELVLFLPTRDFRLDLHDLRVFAS